MTATSKPVEEAQTITRLAEGVSEYASGNGMAWTTSKPGLHSKTLYDSPGSDERTLLFKMDPGARSEMHSHTEIEQIYVLEGSFHDGERLLHAGDHCVRAPGAMHIAASDEGATMLVIYTPNPNHPSPGM